MCRSHHTLAFWRGHKICTHCKHNRTTPEYSTVIPRTHTDPLGSDSRYVNFDKTTVARSVYLWGVMWFQLRSLKTHGMMIVMHVCLEFRVYGYVCRVTHSPHCQWRLIFSAHFWVHSQPSTAKISRTFPSMTIACNLPDDGIC